MTLAQVAEKIFNIQMEEGEASAQSASMANFNRNACPRPDAVQQLAASVSAASLHQYFMRVRLHDVDPAAASNVSPRSQVDQLRISAERAVKAHSAKHNQRAHSALDYESSSLEED